MKRVGYLGPDGTYSEAALQRYLGTHDRDTQTVSGASIPVLFDSFESGDLDEVVLPLENSTEGAVSNVLDLLVQSSGLIIHTISCSIGHVLMANKGVALSKITDVISHPQPLGQCTRFLHSELPHARQHASSSTAAAVSQMTDLEGVVAVIGSRELAEVQSLEILARDIQDYATNQTVFGVLGSQIGPPSGDDRSFIVFSTQKDQSGSLVSILKLFSDAGINLTKILSRPSKTQVGEYLFFIELEGHAKDELVASVLGMVSEKSLYFKLLGAYPTPKE